MPPFPLDLISLLTKPGAYLVYALIGFGFGYALEISGFAISTRLAAQFYLKDMTVLKVMFTAIVVAMLLIFGATALGLLDYNVIWVNPTYLWPGIVGGLIMGVGFIVGGFCPGTSLVALSTFKIDGLFFTLGGLLGIFLFGETVESFDAFWHSSYMGRFTLPELFNTSYGVVIVGVIIMALVMFWGAEQLERIFGKKEIQESFESTSCWGSRIAGRCPAGSLYRSTHHRIPLAETHIVERAPDQGARRPDPSRGAARPGSRSPPECCDVRCTQ